MRVPFAISSPQQPITVRRGGASPVGYGSLEMGQFSRISSKICQNNRGVFIAEGLIEAVESVENGKLETKTLRNCRRKKMRGRANRTKNSEGKVGHWPKGHRQNQCQCQIHELSSLCNYFLL
ncbi:hypothetical protein niasHS_006865 [Heterodera schachtii]|uniref:Uncharacterized protein n=1 Tax=Heterodera schachtii TaxID=97005 RepID=A0ABD2JFS5_HETSC